MYAILPSPRMIAHSCSRYESFLAVHHLLEKGFCLIPLFTSLLYVPQKNICFWSYCPVLPLVSIFEMRNQAVWERKAGPLTVCNNEIEYLFTKVKLMETTQDHLPPEQCCLLYVFVLLAYNYFQTKVDLCGCSLEKSWTFETLPTAFSVNSL